MGLVQKLSRNWHAGLEIEYAEGASLVEFREVEDFIVVGSIRVKRHVSLRVALQRKFYFSGHYYSALGVSSGKATSDTSATKFRADTNAFHVAFGRETSKNSNISLNITRALLDYKNLIRDDEDGASTYNNFVYSPMPRIDRFWPDKKWSTTTSLKLGILF